MWSHGFVSRYFDEFPESLWMRRWRCPECRAVHTARPLEYWRGFWASASTIVASLWSRIEEHRWLASHSRQRQEYWWRGLEICRLIHGLGAEVDALLDSGKIIATHSLDYREVRYLEEPLHRIFAFTAAVRAP